MNHPSRTAQRRNPTRGAHGVSSSRPNHTFRRAVATGQVIREACRSLGRRLVATARGAIHAASAAADLLLFAWSRRTALVPIPIDSSSAKIRRSRMNHRR